jgi:hypothetical protein
MIVAHGIASTGPIHATGGGPQRLRGAAMEVSLSALSLRLPQGATMRLEAARGAELRVRGGTLWLTEEGRPDDVFLGPGASWRLRADGRTVVEAGSASDFELVGPGSPWRIAPRASPGTTLAARLRSSLARLRRAPGWMPLPPPSARLR